MTVRLGQWRYMVRIYIKPMTTPANDDNADKKTIARLRSRLLTNLKVAWERLCAPTFLYLNLLQSVTTIQPSLLPKFNLRSQSSDFSGAKDLTTLLIIKRAEIMAPAHIHDPMDHDFPHFPVEATHESNQHKNNQHEIPVLLPDLFVSFLSRKPQLNPHYESIRAESEAWISESVIELVFVFL